MATAGTPSVADELEREHCQASVTATLGHDRRLAMIVQVRL